MGQGGFVPSTKYDQYTLKSPGDTLKIPLFWPKLDRCDWELIGLSIDLRGRPILMSQLNLKEKSWKHLRPTRAMPDSLAYLCKPDSGGRQLECNLKGEETDYDYILNDTVEINRIQVDVGFEKQ
jgi:hypothetical protein